MGSGSRGSASDKISAAFYPPPSSAFSRWPVRTQAAVPSAATKRPGPGEAGAEAEQRRTGARAAVMASLPARRALLAAALGPAGRRRLTRHHGNRPLLPLPGAAPLSPGPFASLPTAPAAARPFSGAGGQEEAEGPSRATAMLRHLLLKLRATGPVTVAEYMREALTNPGQVRAGAGRPLGRRGLRAGGAAPERPGPAVWQAGGERPRRAAHRAPAPLPSSSPPLPRRVTTRAAAASAKAAISSPHLK